MVGTRSRTRIRAAILTVAFGALLSTFAVVYTAQAAPQPDPGTDPARSGPRIGTALANPDAVLPSDWRRSTDRVVTTAGDADGLDVLVADQSEAYQWRTAARLAEPAIDTNQWIGAACLTGSGTRAVVMYAPRQFTNGTVERASGGFVAIVDVTSGAVRKLSVRASLAYFNPGCGAGEDVALTRFADDGASSSTVSVVDAATGRTRYELTTSGQLTSAVPVGAGVVAADGAHLVSLTPGQPERTLTTEAGIPFRLHPDRAGAVGYQVPSGGQVGVRRWAAGTSTLLGTGKLGAVQVTGSAGQVFVTGPDSGKVRPAAGWQVLPVPVNVDVSTTGALAVLNSTKQRSAQVSIDARVTRTGKSVSFSLHGDPPQPADGVAMSPGFTATAPGRAPAAGIAPAVDPSTVPWDPDRACSVPRNDTNIETFQATAKQVEWAVDQAVYGKLTVSRPVNWKNSGMPVSWKPQSMFPRHTLSGSSSGHVPAQVLLGILAQESNTMQASPHAVDGLTANVNQGGFYGDWVSWSTVDCGYGAGQVTTGMAVKDGTSVYQPNQQRAIATDYASNIAASLDALVDKWNLLRKSKIVAGDGDPQYIENWYLAAWAYNTGLQPDALRGNTTGCTPSPTCTDSFGNWGLGWLNNPANPIYPVDRGLFSANVEFDLKNPNLWPYQEKVMGWAYTPVARFDYRVKNWAPAYMPGVWHSPIRLPDFSTFCAIEVDQCEPGGATDVNNKNGAGLCIANGSHCWWHFSTSWETCTPLPTEETVCGTEALSYPLGAPEPSAPVVYPADCSTTGLTNAAIVDDVTTPSVLPCTKTWQDQGSFTFKFAKVIPAGCTSQCITYPGKIDLHQVGTGFGGHLWFTHTQTAKTVTGTWTPPATTVGWTRIKVHIPQNGATTEQADYTINLGNGQTRHRVVNQHWEQNLWVDLGTFKLASGATVTLSNASSHVAKSRVDGGDLAFDAVAFIPSSQPDARYVALGDSYSSGESNIPFEADSDLNKVNECHRSLTQAYSHQVKLPGHSKSIADENTAGKADFHFLACSGAQSVDLTQAAVQPGNTDNTDWRTVNNYHYGEVNQIEESGWLDQDTTLVTLSVGGNDVGFADIVQGCLLPTLSLTCLSPTFRLTRSFGDEGHVHTRKDTKALTDYEPYLIGQLRAHLTAVYKKVHQVAPNARVIVVGYPRLFDTKRNTQCEGFNIFVQGWMNQMADLMTQNISGAVSDANLAYPNMSIQFVNVTAGFTGHAVCEDSAPEWINGINLLNQKSSMHPNATGQKKYAALVNAIM
jgi:hypothetical protein